MLHTLEDGNFDMAILPFGVNNLVQKRNQSQTVYELILNLKITAIKCMSLGVIVWGIAFNNKRVANSFVDQANCKSISMCEHN